MDAGALVRAYDTTDTGDWGVALEAGDAESVQSERPDGIEDLHRKLAAADDEW